MKIIVITGVSNGIGLDTAKYFLQKGHTVFGISRSKTKLTESENTFTGSFHYIKADICNENELISAVQIIKSKTNTVDILINNAGILINKPFTQLTKNDFTQLYNTNIIAAATLIQQLLPLMLDKVARTHIINIGSMGGFQGSIKFPGLSAYSSSKAALANLTECIAEELKDNNVSVNCLALGAVNTNMLQNAFPTYKADVNPSEMADFIGNFALNNSKLINGKTIPVTINTP